MSIESLYHYTNLTTSLEYILPSMKLLLNPIVNTNDPRENKPYNFATLVNDIDYSADSRKENKYYSDELRKNCKVICFSIDHSYESQIIKGHNLSRMWAQYGDNHKGICFEFDFNKFKIENKRFICDKFFKPVRYFGFNKGFYPTIDKRNDGYTKRQILSKTMNLHSDYLFFSKLMDWESEHEFRLIHFGKSQRKQYCTIKNSLKAIYLGVDFNLVYLPSVKKFVNGFDVFKLEFHHDRLVCKKIYL